MALELTPDDLAAYLGVSVDEERAELLLELATSLVEAIITPVPESAKAVVLTAAGRAYTNPLGITQEVIGPYQTSRPSAGVYLTKGERSSLRLLIGRGGAFSFDVLGINGELDVTDYPDARFPDEDE